jgi:hypothetical protein
METVVIGVARWHAVQKISLNTASVNRATGMSAHAALAD